MAKRTTKKASSTIGKSIKTPGIKKAGQAVNKKVPGPSTSKKEELKKPGLRSIYSNSKHTLMTLGFGSDFKTKKCVVIFSDLPTGQVHTTTLAVWNRMKLKEVKDIKPQP